MLRVNGFYGHVQKNHGRSIILFSGFVLACQIAIGVLLTVPIIMSGSTEFIFVAPLKYLQNWGLQVLAVSTVLFAVRYHFHLYFMKSAIGFTPVSQHSHPRLLSIITNHAIAAGVPVPSAAIIQDTALNAFACGLSKSQATVIVTQGLLDGLDDDELSAVIAHEIAHIMNGDMQMMAVANASMGTVDMINNINPFKFRGGKSVIFAVIFLPLLFLFLMFGFAMSISATITKITRLLIASSREFIADAEAVRLTHNPGALISALRKIDGRSQIEGLDPMADAMMIDGAVDGAYATHPPINERIAVLTQLSGSMVHGQAVRNDSRTRAQVVAYNTRTYGSERPNFGSRFAHTYASHEPDSISSKPFYRRNLIDRVNAGSDTNAFGISSKVGKMLLIGIPAFIAFKMLTISSMSNTVEALEGSIPASSAEFKSNEIRPMFREAGPMIALETAPKTQRNNQSLDSRSSEMRIVPNKKKTHAQSVPSLRGRKTSTP